MERGVQLGSPRHGHGSRPQLAQQHGAQLGVLPEEGLQAHPLRQAALPTAPLLAQQPGREGTCRDRAESSVRSPLSPARPTMLLHRFCRDLSPSVLTEELDGCVPHGPTRRAQAPQGQGHHRRGVPQHRAAQPRATHQCLQHMAGTHLGRARGAQQHLRGEGAHASEQREGGGKDRGAKGPSALGLPGWAAWPGLHFFAHPEVSVPVHSLLLGYLPQFPLGDLVQITLSPNGLQQPGALRPPRSPAGGRGSGPSPAAGLWWPRLAVSGCSGSAAAVPAPGPPR